MQSNSAAVLVRGFVNLVVSQVSVRLINFALNLVTARLLTPEAYGRGTQEGLPKNSEGFAAFVELCCGPLYILAKVQLADAVVAVAEGAATIAKGALTLLLLKKSSMPVPIALSWAQVAYGGVTMAIYLAYYVPGFCKWMLSMPSDSFCLSKQVVLGPYQPPGSGSSQHAAGQAAEVQRQQRAAAADDFLLDSRSLALCWRFLLQAIVHLAQTEGSKIVMALCQSSYNQGVYGLVTNLGSLVVRTIFFPVEEAAFRAFSRPSGKDVEADKKQKIQILAILVRISGLTGLLAAAFGPSYTYVLLRLMYGQKWSSTEAPAALACYCGYICLLAVNGCTEAYVNAVADTRQLSKSIRWQTVFSAAQVILSFALVWRLGAIGLILADSANMVMRISYSWHFIKSAVPGLRITAWAPSFDFPKQDLWINTCHRKRGKVPSVRMLYAMSALGWLC
ncbi:MAG: RFT1 protein [Trebouxia sp. A1-2]|nr:MAG: RFT1 protein [Trebouxia sp. A1-2]